MNNDDALDIAEYAIDKRLSLLHTCLVGRVEKVNTDTIDVQPVTKKVVNGSVVNMPLFSEVPPIFIQGGSSYDAMPIAVGDYCLLIISEDCIDRWYDGNDNLEPLEDRHFDYSDAFALVGVNPQSKAIEIPSVATYKGDRVTEGNWSNTGNWTHIGNLNLTGTLTVTGNIILNGVDLDDFVQNHVHTTTTTGNPTSPPL